MTRAARGSPKSAKCRKGASASRARPSAATRITFAEKNAKKRKKGKAETACFLLLFASSFVFCGPLLLSLFRSFLPEEQDVGPLRCRAGPATILERTRRAQSRSCETKPILRFRIADCGLRIVDCGLEARSRPEPIVRNEPNLLGSTVRNEPNLPQVSGNGCGWLGPGGSAGERLCETKPNLGRMGPLGDGTSGRGQWCKTNPIPEGPAGAGCRLRKTKPICHRAM
jgi:hypothetical protein